MMYVMVDFISMGLVDLRGKRSKRELQNEKPLPTVGFEPKALGFEIKRLISFMYTTRSDTNERLKLNTKRIQ